MGNMSGVSFARSPTLPGVELLLVTQSTHLWRVFHEQYAICTCDTAAARIRYRGDEYMAVDQSALFYEPGEIHNTFHVAKPQDFQVVFFSAELLRSFGDEMGCQGATHFASKLTGDKQFFSAFKRLHASITEETSVIEQQTNLALCAGLLLSCYTERRTKPPKDVRKDALFRARDFVQEMFAHAIFLDDLAAIAGLSRFHLLKAFTHQFGLPPHKYQIHLRIERSLPLLRQGMTLANVASEMGFTDQSHYIRHFKRIKGVTPRQYREASYVGRIPLRLGQSAAR
jgi:AraC-like DNA-binding protein